MCGIAGIISFNASEVSGELLEKMNHAQRHRGPDGNGIYLDNQQEINVGFSHSRLSIIDISQNSAQPFIYLERYLIIHNGEIYNYQDLRDSLKKYNYDFRSEGDTEVIAAAYAHYGESCVEHFNGMFAFAIWDMKDKKLFCARDRFGEKPFHYHYNSDTGSLYFASEMKALFAAGIKKEINMHLMHAYLTLGITKFSNFPEQTFYQGILRLQPAHKLIYEPLKHSIYTETYWDLDKETRSSLTEQECFDQFNELLSLSVQNRTRTDVAYGSTLSGGIDSASIAYLLASRSDKQYSKKTFSAVFPGFINDEQNKIQAITNQLGLDPVFVFPDQYSLIEDFEKMMYHQEEPVNSSSVFAQYKVYETAKENGIKVLIDGQGADEVLGGYIKYTKWYLQEIRRTSGLRRANKEAADYSGNDFLNDWGINEKISSFSPLLTKFILERRSKKTVKNQPYITNDFKTHFDFSENIFKPVIRKLHDILYFDIMISGLDELLRYADRNSMAHGCEVRLPFLDHQLVTLLFSSPITLKYSQGWNKWALRKFMNKKLPDNIVWQKGKIGFETPQEHWMSDAIMKDVIMESRSIMIQKGICKKEFLHAPIKSKPVHDADNFEWRCLSASSIIK